MIHAEKMGAIQFDDTRFPLVVVTFNGTATDAEFSDYLARMSELVSRKQKNVTVFDARSSGVVPAIQRKRQADWIAANRQGLKEYSCGSAFVISSAVVRGALTAILWLQPIPVSHIVLGSVEEAERWAMQRLVTEGVSPPSWRGRAFR